MTIEEEDCEAAYDEGFADGKLAALAEAEAELSELRAEVARLQAMLSEVQEAEASDPLKGLVGFGYIDKIKAVRAKTGLSLVEAKALVDRAQSAKARGEA